MRIFFVVIALLALLAIDDIYAWWKGLPPEIVVEEESLITVSPKCSIKKEDIKNGALLVTIKCPGSGD